MQPHNHVCEPIATVDGHVAYSCRTCGQVAPPTVASALTATKSYYVPPRTPWKRPRRTEPSAPAPVSVPIPRRRTQAALAGLNLGSADA